LSSVGPPGVTSKIQFPRNSNTKELRDFALGIYKQYAKTTANGGPPILGTHILMGESSAVKSKNLLENITAGHLAPVEIIAQKN